MKFVPLLLAIAPAIAACEKTPSSVTLDLGLHDLGTIADTPATATEFRLPNTDHSAWRVERALSTCGCVSVSVRTPVVLPGEELVVTATLNLRVDKPTPVSQSVYVTIFPGERLAIGRVRAELMPAPYLVPDAGSVVISESAATFSYELVLVGPRTSVSLESDDDIHLVSAMTQPATVAGSAWTSTRIALEGAAPLENMTYYARLIARAEDAAVYTLPLSVAVRRQRRIVLDPEYVCVVAKDDRTILKVRPVFTADCHYALGDLEIAVVPSEYGSARVVQERSIEITLAGLPARSLPLLCRLEVKARDGSIGKCTIRVVPP